MSETVRLVSGGGTVQVTGPGVDILAEVEKACPDVSLGAILSVTVGFDARKIISVGGSSNGDLLAWRVGSDEGLLFCSFPIGSTAAAFTSGPQTLQPNGQPWDLAAINALRIAGRTFFDLPSGSHFGTLFIAQAYADVEVEQAPQAGIIREPSVGPAVADMELDAAYRVVTVGPWASDLELDERTLNPMLGAAATEYVLEEA